MDIPNKIFSVSISSKGKRNHFDFDESNLATFKILFSFIQNEEVIIDFINKNYCLEIETNENEDGTYLKYISSFEIPFILNSNLFQTVPFIYRINVLSAETKKRVYSAFYKSKPLAGVNDDQYDNMIAKLMQIDEALIFSEGSNKLGSKIYGLRRQLKFYKNVIDNILSNKNAIMYSLSNIESNFNVSIKKVIKKGAEPKKQSRKTAILNAVKRNEYEYYSSVVIKDYNTNLNSYLMFIIEKTTVGLNQLHNIALKKIESLNDTLLFHRDILKNDIGQNSRAQKEKMIMVIESELKKMIGFISLSNILIAKLNRIYLKMLELQIKKTSVRDSTISLNKDYSLIETFLYLPIQYNYFAISFSFNNLYASIKQDTSKLFEMYCVTLFVEAFFEIGFSSNQDINSFILGLLQSNNEQELTLGEYKIRVSYEANTVDSFSVSKSGLSLTAFEEDVTPDLYFILLKNDQPLYFFICDFKCRFLTQLFKESKKKSKTNGTIRKYSAIQYFMQETRNFVKADQLCFVCPGNEIIEQGGPNNLYNIKTIIVDGNDESIKKVIASTVISMMV